MLLRYTTIPWYVRSRVGRPNTECDAMQRNETIDNFLSRIVQFDEVSDNDDDASDYHYFLLLFFENLNEDDRNGKVKCNMVVYSVTCAPCSISWLFSWDETRTNFQKTFSFDFPRNGYP